MTAQTEIRNKVRECVNMAREKFGSNLRYEDITIKFVARGQYAGQASCRLQRLTRNAFDFTLKFQLEAYELDSEEFLERTVPHEVAHLVCYDQPHLGKNHNDGWRRVDIALGGNGSRTHQEVLSKARYKTQYLYIMPSGREFKCSAVRHRKMQRGTYYTFRNGERMEGKHFVRVIGSDEHRRNHEKKVAAHAAKKTGKDIRVAKPSQAAQHTESHKRRKRMATTGTPSKLDACRQLFTSGWSRQENIDTFVRSAGCTPAGAATYYAKIKKERT